MSLRNLIKLAALASTCWMSVGQALAENRIALVIGNSNYTSVTALPNPANDAKAMTNFLNSAGFQVVQAPDLTQSDMRRTIAEFAKKVTEKGPDTVALIFYAGHGIQVDGVNWLIPVDARVEGGDLRPERAAAVTLDEFGRAYIELLCRPGGGSAIRTVMAIAERMPDVGSRFYVNVMAKTIDGLADYLRAHVRPNDLAIDDCGLAAAQFMQMCQASLFLPFVFQVTPSPSPERIAQVVDSATRMFLAAYRAK